MPQSTTKYTFLFGSLTLALWLSGCGGCDTPPTEPDSGPVVEAACVKEDARIAARDRCGATDDCPCGTYCSLGECVAQCRDDGDCDADAHCNLMGQCSTSTDSRRTPNVRPEREGTLVVSNPILQVFDGSTPRTVRVSARGVDVGATRFVADEGVEVSCDGQVFQDECRLDGVTIGGSHQIVIRPTGIIAPGTIEEVHIYAGSQRETISVTSSSIQSRRSLGFTSRIPVALSGPLAGRYEGRARILGTAVTDDINELGAEPEEGSAIALTADVHANANTGNATVVLHDPTALLNGQDTWIGALVVDANGEDGTLDFPSAILHTGSAYFGADVEVVVEAPTATVKVGDAGARSIAFDLVTRNIGVLPSGRAPQTRWSVALFRTDDLAANASEPPVPADAVSSFSENDVTTPSGWVAAMNQSLKSAVATPTKLFGPNDDVYQSFTGTEANLIACALSDEQEAVYQSIFLEAVVGDGTIVDGDGPLDFVRFDLSSDPNRADPPAPTSEGPLAGLFLADTFATDIDGYINIPIVSDFMNVELQPSAVGPEIPCAFSGGQMSIVETEFSNGSWEPLPYTYDLTGGTPVDICESLSTTFGCIVEDAPANDSFDFALGGGGEFQDNLAGSFGSYNFGGTTTVDVQRRCIFPESTTNQAVAKNCGEMALCFNADAEGGSSTLTNIALPVSGDLECPGATQGASLPLDRNENGLKAPALRNACLDNLERLTTDPVAVDLSTMFESGDCLDAARVLYAIDAALQTTRNRVMAGNTNLRPDDETLALRLLQRWVQVHGFVAQESAQSERLGQVIRRISPSDPDIPPPVDDVLESSLNGWNLLLHPRIATGIDGLAASTLAITDYRPHAAPDFVDDRPEGREQGDGLALAMVDALTAQASLVHIRLERAMATGDMDALLTAKNYLKYVGMVRPLAQSIYGKAKAHVGSDLLPWENRYIAATGRLSSAIDRVHQLMTALRDGTNPLGIDDSDLPLYFFADETGAGGRFSAISDFLLGESPSSATNFAPYAVRQAQEAMEDARTAWVAYKDRQTQRDQSAAELDEKLEDIHLRFAGELTSYCGTPGTLATVEVLENWESAQGEPFSADRCYFKMNEPGCDTNIGPWAAQLSSDDILYQYCVANEVKERVGALVRSRHEVTEQILSNYQECVVDGEYPVPCPGGNGDCFACASGTVAFVPSPNVFENLLDGVPTGITDQARATCIGEFPAANPQMPGIDSVDLPALDNPSCYRGSLGEAALTARAVAQDIAVARSEYAEFQERYDIAMNGCLILENGNAAIEAAQEKHNDTMTGLRSAKLAVDIVATAAGGVKDCAATASGAETPWNKGAAGVACGAGAVEAAADIASDSLQFAMDEVTANHEELLLSLNNATAEQQCYNDAEMELVGATTATLRIQRAIADLQIALYQMNELKVLAQTAYDDGLSTLAAAKGRAVAPLDHDYWLDEELERYLRRYRIASRITYLTVRAVEYEYQESLSARGDVLAAEIPDDLEQALDTLWTTAGTRRINGAAPTDLKVVISLKKHLLQLADNSEQAAGQSQYSDTERLRLLLVDPKHQVFDDEGTFLGYQVPFQLAPLEQLGLGEINGIGVFARNSCAERLWSVNATIQGDEEKLFIGDDPSFVDVQLLKSNSFYSQWCSVRDGSAFQEATVRPSRNLFADPGLGSLVGDQLGLGDEVRLMSRARMQAFFNVDRDEFSDDQYANGDTSELAARGLYGEYAIFFPAGTLSVEGANGAQSDGLDLNAIDDILLRLDYVSVAR